MPSTEIINLRVGHPVVIAFRRSSNWHWRSVFQRTLHRPSYGARCRHIRAIYLPNTCLRRRCALGIHM